MFWNNVVVVLLAAFGVSSALRWDPEHVGYNLNENETAIEPRDYWGEWDNHTFNPSPKNWRFPFYCITIDRFLDGDPTNNEANGTVFEHHWLSTQFRFGGDTRGLQNDLDYIQGLGIKVRHNPLRSRQRLTKLHRHSTLLGVRSSIDRGQATASDPWTSLF